jgi:hypothetical protein
VTPTPDVAPNRVRSVARWAAVLAGVLITAATVGIVGLRVELARRPDPPPPFHLPDRTPETQTSTS